LKDTVEILAEWKPVFSHDPEKAEKALLHAANQARAVGDKNTEFSLMDELAWQATSRNDEIVALEYIQRALKLAEEFETTEKIGPVRNTFGIFYMNRGESFAAIEQFKEALRAYEESNKDKSIMSVVANIGETLVEMDEFEFAASYIKESIRLAGPNPSVEMLLNYPYILVHEGQVKKAWYEIIRAWKMSKQSRDHLQRAQVHEMAGWIQDTTGNQKAALRHFHYANKLYQANFDHFHEASVYLKTGECYLRMLQEFNAAECFRQAADIAGSHGYRTIETNALRKLLLLSSGPIEAIVVQQRLQKVLHMTIELDRKFQREFVQVRIQNEIIRQSRLNLELALERDKLTGLISYRNITEYLDQLVEKKQFSFLFCDVDRLKYINDKYGHIAGDSLLMQFAKDIEKSLPEEGVAIRKSGDEFIILLPFTDKKTLNCFLSSLYQRLAQKHRILEEELSFSCSIGIAVWPQDTEKIEDLEKLADKSMYYSKSMGRNKATWYKDFIKRKKVLE